jgi:xanthine dehydrogenase accessory factor
MFDEFLRKASELLAAETPFAVAIVVKYEPPVSGKPGDKAIIQSDGKVWGWIGGGCVQPLVIREALAALEEGSPRLVRIAPSADPAPEPGLVNYSMNCHGGGALEIFIEPILSKSRILIFGRSPAAQSLSKLGKAVGYAISVVAPEASKENFPDADIILTEFIPSQVKNRSETYIVVATQGERDEEALENAVRTNARYVSFIASNAKARKIIGFLAGKGVPLEMLNRIKAPAGLHIGTSTPQEIAVSILAEIIQIKKGNVAPVADSQLPEAGVISNLATDPVCGMTVAATEANPKSEYQGKEFYFCCTGCQQMFDQHPENYRSAR